MEKTPQDILTSSLENLDSKDLKRFRHKLLGLGTNITKRQVDDAKDESDLAELLLKNFEDQAFDKTEEIMRFIQCNNTATKLRADFLKAQQAQGVSEEKIGGDSGTLLSGGRPKPIVVQQLSPTEMYSMNNKPRGTCVIFNNVNFCDGGGTRFGSDKDADTLRNTFKTLGFNVEILKDNTVQVMRDKLEDLRKKVTGDCFVCCVLSHGNERGVMGSDQFNLPICDMLSPFSGTNCPALAGKPKLFFIQACRGSQMQKKVEVQADSLDENVMGMDSDYSLDSMFSIPDFADFLIAMSTFEGYFALRNRNTGSWFIQSLCEHLDKLCPQGEDMLSILTKVNNAVGKMGTRSKQIPEPRFSLRKKLVFA